MRHLHLMIGLLVLLGASSPAHAVNILVNSGFETGTFAPWVVVNQAAGSGNWFIQTGTTSPSSALAVPAPPGPTRSAMTDQSGPGCHILYQDFTVPASVTSATLSFKRFRGNRGGPYTTPKPLDYTVTTNQLARVDFTTVAATPFSIAAADVLLNVFMTAPGDPMVDPAYITQSVDVTAFLSSFAGQPLRLRISEVDNTGLFQFGIDDVILDVNGGIPPAPPPPDNGPPPNEGNYPGIGGPWGSNEGTYGFGFGMLRPGQAANNQSPVLRGPFVNVGGSISYGNVSSVQPGGNTGMTVFNVSATANTQLDGNDSGGGPAFIVVWLIAGLLGIAVAAKSML